MLEVFASEHLSDGVTNRVSGVHPCSDLASRRPHKLWLSIPCTFWSSAQNANLANPERAPQILKGRKRSRQMVRSIVAWLIESLDDDADIEVYWEWPHYCRGFGDDCFQLLVRALERRHKPLYDARIDGCRYGMKDSKQQTLVWKPWRIKTTSPTFYKEYKNKTCTNTKRDASGPNDHYHAPLVGAESASSAFYPEGMCQSIAKLWSDELLPGRTIALQDTKRPWLNNSCEARHRLA